MSTMQAYKHILYYKINELTPFEKSRNWNKYCAQVGDLNINSFDQLCWDYRMQPFDMLDVGNFKRCIVPYKTRDLIVAKRINIENMVKQLDPSLLPMKRVDWIKLLTRSQVDLILGKGKRGSMKTIEDIAMQLGFKTHCLLNPFSHNNTTTLYKRIKEIKDGQEKTLRLF